MHIDISACGDAPCWVHSNEMFLVSYEEILNDVTCLHWICTVILIKTVYHLIKIDMQNKISTNLYFR